MGDCTNTWKHTRTLLQHYYFTTRLVILQFRSVSIRRGGTLFFISCNIRASLRLYADYSSRISAWTRMSFHR